MKKSRIIKSITALLLSSIFVIGASTSALANESKEHNTNENLLEEVTKLNDEGWNELISEIDHSQKPQTKDVYLKVIEDPENPHIETKEYSHLEYLAETYKNPRYIDPTTNWLHISYELYPTYGDNFSVLVGFQWQSTPSIQWDDMFLVGSDSNCILPGSTKRINFTYYPNTSLSMYQTYNSIDHRQNFKFEGGAVGSIFDVVPSELKSQISALPDRDKYFYVDRNTGRFLTKGTPKGILGFASMFSSPTTNGTNIGVTYAHKQVVVGMPGISVEVSGGKVKPTLTGNASIGYDQPTTSISFYRGTPIP